MGEGANARAGRMIAPAFTPSPPRLVSPSLRLSPLLVSCLAHRPRATRMGKCPVQLPTPIRLLDSRQLRRSAGSIFPALAAWFRSCWLRVRWGRRFTGKPRMTIWRPWLGGWSWQPAGGRWCRLSMKWARVACMSPHSGGVNASPGAISTASSLARGECFSCRLALAGGVGEGFTCRSEATRPKLPTPCGITAKGLPRRSTRPSPAGRPPDHEWVRLAEPDVLVAAFARTRRAA